MGIGDWGLSTLLAFKHFKLYFNLSNINKINMDQEGDVINNNI